MFSNLKTEDKITVMLSDEELDTIIQWGFIVSAERPLSEKERELYFKITNG